MVGVHSLSSDTSRFFDWLLFLFAFFYFICSVFVENGFEKRAWHPPLPPPRHLPPPPPAPPPRTIPKLPPTPRFLEGPCQQSRKEQVPKVNTCDGEMSSRLGKGGGLKCQRWGQGGNGRTPPTSHAVWQIAHQEQPIVKTDAAAKANENHTDIFYRNSFIFLCFLIGFSFFFHFSLVYFFFSFIPFCCFSVWLLFLSFSFLLFSIFNISLLFG
ncbi:unnamed protein product [Acanthosepion pharaonis]|uniref:Uncharacterized protein n=1 Tax=Acanthosepion pharaonis TaxID=158019 RepID=A0A812EUZ8_ACAPH|nr:unnamed protein product [Sepia pharaonis]